MEENSRYLSKTVRSIRKPSRNRTLMQAKEVIDATTMYRKRLHRPPHVYGDDGDWRTPFSVPRPERDGKEDMREGEK